MNYLVTAELSLPEEANKRFQQLSVKEDFRIIGGDQGDLKFYGYNVINGKTILINPELLTKYDDLSVDEINDYATDILMESYTSIGIETVEHS